MDDQHLDPLDDRVQGILSFTARRLAALPEFVGWDEEDIEQELILHLLRQQHRFDPDVSTGATFAGRIIENRSWSILRFLRAQRRSRLREECSLNDPVMTDGEPAQRYQAMPDRSANDIMRLERALDVAACLSKLDSESRRLVFLLMDGGVVHAARVLRISTQKVRERRALIERAFEDAGLRAYLGDTDATASTDRVGNE